MREFAQNVFRFSIVRRLTRKAKRYPITTAGITLGARYGLGDMMVQLAGDEPWDPSRTLMFVTFGSTYACTFGYGIYNVLYPRFFPRNLPVLNAAFDCMLNSPFIYFPIYYIYRELTITIKEGRKDFNTVFSRGLTTWKEGFWTDVKAVTAFWLPMNSFNFWIVPLHFRQPFMAVAGMCWAMILSNLRGKPEAKGPKPERNSSLEE
ncbi:hypothetical protein AAMO2058_000550300 [Amorphochlora amoebiformis]